MSPLRLLAFVSLRSPALSLGSLPARGLCPQVDLSRRHGLALVSLFQPQPRRLSPPLAPSSLPSPPLPSPRPRPSAPHPRLPSLIMSSPAGLCAQSITYPNYVPSVNCVSVGALAPACPPADNASLLRFSPRLDYTTDTASFAFTFSYNAAGARVSASALSLAGADPLVRSDAFGGLQPARPRSSTRVTSSEKASIPAAGLFLPAEGRGRRICRG